MRCKRTGPQDIQGEQRQDGSLEEVAFGQGLESCWQPKMDRSGKKAVKQKKRLDSQMHLAPKWQELVQGGTGRLGPRRGWPCQGKHMPVVASPVGEQTPEHCIPRGRATSSRQPSLTQRHLEETGQTAIWTRHQRLRSTCGPSFLAGWALSLQDQAHGLFLPGLATSREARPPQHEQPPWWAAVGTSVGILWKELEDGVWKVGSFLWVICSQHTPLSCHLPSATHYGLQRDSLSTQWAGPEPWPALLHWIPWATFTSLRPQFSQLKNFCPGCFLGIFWGMEWNCGREVQDLAKYKSKTAVPSSPVHHLHPPWSGVRWGCGRGWSDGPRENPPLWNTEHNYIQKSDNNKCWSGYREIITLTYCQWEYKTEQLLWEKSGRSLCD